LASASVNRSAVAYKTVNRFVRQRTAAHVLEHGVDGKGEIELGIDEGAVEIEDQNSHGAEFVVI
jgi:hypothetical protein